MLPLTKRPKNLDSFHLIESSKLDTESTIHMQCQHKQFLEWMGTGWETHATWDIPCKAYFNSVFNDHFKENSRGCSTAYGNYL